MRGAGGGREAGGGRRGSVRTSCWAGPGSARFEGNRQLRRQLPWSPGQPGACADTRAHAHTRTRTRIRAHTRSHKHAHTRTYTRATSTCTRALMPTLVPMHTRTHMHTYPRTLHMHAHSHSYTHAHHAHTHTHTALHSTHTHTRVNTPVRVPSGETLLCASPAAASPAWPCPGHSPSRGGPRAAGVSLSPALLLSCMSLALQGPAGTFRLCPSAAPAHPRENRIVIALSV